jgi:hypothetical protein
MRTSRVGRALLAALLLTATAAARVLADEDEISPACGDYHANVIVVDGLVNKPTTLTIQQLAEVPGQRTANISFVDRLNNVQHHTDKGPLLWDVLSLSAGGIQIPQLLDEQYQGPNPLVTLYVMAIATNGYQTLRFEAEIDPFYGNQPVLLSLAEDGVSMTQAPYASTNKSPAQLVVPGDQRGGRYANRICRISVLNGAVGTAEGD